jgi:hypothetical protein
MGENLNRLHSGAFKGGARMWNTQAQPQPMVELWPWTYQSPRAIIPYLPPDPRLCARQQALLQTCGQNCLPVEYLGTGPLFDGHRVYSGRRYDWVLANLPDDPLFHDRDGFPVPKQVLKDLRAVQKSGVDFDALYVAHQVPRGTVYEGERLRAEMLMPPPSRAMQRLSGYLGVIGRVLWALASLPIIACGAIGRLLLVTTAVEAVAGLDPVVLGVVVGPERPVVSGEPAAWFYLTHWAFD